MSTIACRAAESIRNVYIRLFGLYIGLRIYQLNESSGQCTTKKSFFVIALWPDTARPTLLYEFQQSIHREDGGYVPPKCTEDIKK